MSKSLLAAVLLPLVACSAKNAKPEYAASEASDASTEQVGSHLYEPDDATPNAGVTGDTTDAGKMAGTTDDKTGATTGADSNLSNDVTAQAERTFADQMIAHHEDGIQLAKLAQQRAEHAELKDLAANMVTKQEAQLSELKMLTQGDVNQDLGSDDGLEDLHGQLNTTRTPAASHDATAMHDGVGATAQDGLDQPAGADKTASSDDASATGELGYTQDDDATNGMTGSDRYETAATTPPATTGEQLDAAEKDETARNTGAIPSDDVEATASTGATAGATGAQPGANVPGAETGADVAGDDKTAANDEPGLKAEVETGSKDLESLASAEDFDQAFLAAMIEHHEKGIAMARAVSPRLEGEAKQLADAIVATQSEEVAKMKAWQQAWFEGDKVTSTM